MGESLRGPAPPSLLFKRSITMGRLQRSHLQHERRGWPLDAPLKISTWGARVSWRLAPGPAAVASSWISLHFIHGIMGNSAAPAPGEVKHGKRQRSGLSLIHVGV